MEATKGLKYALVLVLISSAVLLGWTTYLERKTNAQVEAFAEAIGQVDSEDSAKKVIRNFLLDSNHGAAALSASADGQSCSWLCE